MSNQSETPEETDPYIAPEHLIEDKLTATKNAYRKLEHIPPHSLPARLSMTLLLNVILPAVITILLIQRFSPLIIGVLALALWGFRLLGPTDLHENLRNGYQINPETAHEDEQLLYDLFIEICEEMNCNPDNYNLIIHDSSGVAHADPNNNNIFITHDTIEQLSKTELKSVLAHELTHTTHAPNLSRIYTLTTIPLPLIAAPIATLTISSLELLTVLILIGLFKKIATLTVSRQMELESDREIPQHYHHHYAHTLAQISTKTPHIQSRLGQLFYAFIDSHPPINERIKTTVDIDLPKPNDYTAPSIFDHFNNLLALITPAFFTIGLLEFFIKPEYAAASGLAVLLFTGQIFITSLEKPDSSITRTLIGTSILFLILYALGAFITNLPFIPPLTSPTIAVTHIFQVVGHLINRIILTAAVGFLSLGILAISLNYFNEGEPIETNTIYDDTYQEDALREHYK